MGPLGELGALFNPGMRHEIEERQAKANRREEEGNARDGDLRIDLASGVAVINLSSGSGEHPTAPAGEPYGEAESADADRDVPLTEQDSSPEQSDGPVERSAAPWHRSAADAGTTARSDADSDDSQAVDGAQRTPSHEGKPLTAAQARRLATAARRSANGERPVRTATPRPANAQLPSSKASRAAR